VNKVKVLLGVRVAVCYTVYACVRTYSRATTEEEVTEMEKYMLTDEERVIRGLRLHRIQAITDIPPYVRKGQFGGWVEGAYNLSQEGSCWVHEEAVVAGDGVVKEDAQVRYMAMVLGGTIKGYASVGGEVLIVDKVEVSGYAMVLDTACVGGHVVLRGHSRTDGDAVLVGNTVLEDRMWVSTLGSVTKEKDVWYAGTVGPHRVPMTVYRGKGHTLYCATALAHTGDLVNAFRCVEPLHSFEGNIKEWFADEPNALKEYQAAIECAKYSLGE